MRPASSSTVRKVPMNLIEREEGGGTRDEGGGRRKAAYRTPICAG
jgi:hypothetical protein